MILVDTNVITQLTRADPEMAVLNWIAANENEILLSTVVLGEMSFGISRLPDGRRKERLRYALDSVVDRYSSKIVSYGVYEAEAYGLLMARAHFLGMPMSIPDGMIAASARVLNISLATQNIEDFQTTGLVLINPWSLTFD